MRLPRVLRFGSMVFPAVVFAGILHAQDDTQLQMLIAQQQMTQQQQQIIQQQQMTQQQMATDEGQGLRARAPKFSMKPGSYPGVIQVKIKARSRGSVIFYTTDGWTPTRASNLYTGPIRITETTTLQAIALSPYYGRSVVASALYTLPALPSSASSSAPASAGQAAEGASPAVPPTAVLPKGTAVPLIFTGAVTSKGVKVGDALPVVLAQDLYAGHVLIAARGTPVVATVFQVDKAGVQGFPGVIQFQVSSLRRKDGTTLPLQGSQKKEGFSNYTRATLLDLVPAGGVFVRGKEAVIDQGARLTATTAADASASADMAAVRGVNP
jgi:hypothetical protein